MISQVVPRCERCGCVLPAALTRIQGQIICYECQNQDQVIETHHPYGKDDDSTIELPANVHRELDTLRIRWPGILKGKVGGPLVRLAQKLRFKADLYSILAKQMYVHSDNLIQVELFLRKHKREV